MSRHDHRLILLFGHPRSGTTWLSELLAAGRGLVDEPDNEGLHPLGFGYKRAPRFPSGNDYASSGLPTVFERACAGDPEDLRRKLLRRPVQRSRWLIEPWIANNCGDAEATAIPAELRRRNASPDRFPLSLLAAACRRAMPPQDVPAERVVKSVHSIRCIESVEATVGGSIVVLLRNPYALVASMRRPLPLRGVSKPVVNPDTWRAVVEATPPDVPRDVFQVLTLMGELRDQIQRNPHWLVLSHDQLCRTPESELERAATLVGLDPGPVLDELKVRRGIGTGLSVNRRDMVGQIDGWVDELTPETVDTVACSVDELGLAPLLDEYAITGQR